MVSLYLITILLFGLIPWVIPIQVGGEEKLLLYDDFDDDDYNGWEVKTGNRAVEDGPVPAIVHQYRN